MSLLETLKANANSLNSLTSDVEFDQITEGQLLYALRHRVIPELQSVCSALERTIKENKFIEEMKKQETLV